MYWPGSNGVGSPSKRTQNEASDWCWSLRSMSDALYCSAAGSTTRASVASSVMAQSVAAGSHGDGGSSVHWDDRGRPTCHHHAFGLSFDGDRHGEPVWRCFELSHLVRHRR